MTQEQFTHHTPELATEETPAKIDPTQVGAWVESDTNFRWLCVFHHRAAEGAHTASHSDWTA